MVAASSSAGCNVQPGAGVAEPGTAAVSMVDNNVLEAVQSQRPPLSAVLEEVQSQVPQRGERDRVLDALRHLASGANQKDVRSLAGQWGVRQKVGGDNRGTVDIRNEVEDNVRRAAMRLLQKEEVREEGAGAVAREEYATEASVSQSGREAVVLTEPTTDARSARSSSSNLAKSAGRAVAREESGTEVSVSQSVREAVVLTEPTTDASSARSSSPKVAKSAGKRAAFADCASRQSEMARHGKKRRMPEGAAADTKVPEALDVVSLSLQAKPVVDAIALLDTLPVGKRADELRDLLLKWRAGASCQGKSSSTFGR